MSSRNVTIPLTGVEAKAIAGSVGAVADEPLAPGGPRLMHAAATGTRSTSQVTSSGVRGEVAAPVDAGRRGESRVIARVLDRLRLDGVPAALQTSRDDAGEDAVITIDGDNWIVQIVTVMDRLFWSMVARGTGSFSASKAEAVACVHEAISTKAALYPPAQKAVMLLAVDVGHFGALASSAVVAQYLSAHGDPCVAHEFGAVWLVGPTEDRVAKLGSGRW